MLQMIIKKYWQVLTPRSPVVDWSCRGEVTASIINSVVSRADIAGAQDYFRDGAFVRPWVDVATAHGRYIGRRWRVWLPLLFWASKCVVDSTAAHSPARAITIHGGRAGILVPVHPSVVYQVALVRYGYCNPSVSKPVRFSQRRLATQPDTWRYGGGWMARIPSTYRR
jgi:hypothetical protein